MPFHCRAAAAFYAINGDHVNQLRFLSCLQLLMNSSVMSYELSGNDLDYLTRQNGQRLEAVCPKTRATAVRRSDPTADAGCSTSTRTSCRMASGVPLNVGSSRRAGASKSRPVTSSSCSACRPSYRKPSEQCFPGRKRRRSTNSSCWLYF